ncbi:hypothetical protein K501DRAFT_268419 [Backusella circina FSU 941]|nr:hypothetical protein K501DRAFT_268419 [Backusella circina FSU 941]
MANIKTEPLQSVQLDGLVVLKIIKHCRESYPSDVTGQLLGLDDKGSLEVTNCFPFPSDGNDDTSGATVMVRTSAVKAFGSPVEPTRSSEMGLVGSTSSIVEITDAVENGAVRDDRPRTARDTTTVIMTPEEVEGALGDTTGVITARALATTEVVPDVKSYGPVVEVLALCVPLVTTRDGGWTGIVPPGTVAVIRGFQPAAMGTSAFQGRVEPGTNGLAVDRAPT